MLSKGGNEHMRTLNNTEWGGRGRGIRYGYWLQERDDRSPSSQSSSTRFVFFFRFYNDLRENPFK